MTARAARPGQIGGSSEGEILQALGQMQGQLLGVHQRFDDFTHSNELRIGALRADTVAVNTRLFQNIENLEKSLDGRIDAFDNRMKALETDRSERSGALKFWEFVRQSGPWAAVLIWMLMDYVRTGGKI